MSCQRNVRAAGDPGAGADDVLELFADHGPSSRILAMISSGTWEGSYGTKGHGGGYCLMIARRSSSVTICCIPRSFVTDFSVYS